MMAGIYRSDSLKQGTRARYTVNAVKNFVVETLVKHFASLLGARGIRVNAVAPGVVDTDMSTFTKTEAGRDFVLGMQALKGLAQQNWRWDASRRSPGGQDFPLRPLLKVG
jgi:3-oxoacyl-[acyl-carrier protein] reductase